MKRMIRALIAAAVLVSSLTCSAFAATKDYTTDINGTVNYDTANGTYSASCTGLTSGKQYVLLVAEGTPDNYAITENSILYIDQAGSDGSISFPAFIPKNIADSVVLLGGEFADGSSPKVLGTIKSQYMLGDVDLDGSVMPNDAYTTLQMYVGLLTNYTNAQFMAADVDFDSQVMPNDAYKILQYYVGLITEF